MSSCGQTDEPAVDQWDVEKPESVIRANGETHTVAAGNSATIARESADRGRVHYVANRAGGIVTITEKVHPWGEATDIQQCPQCDRFYDAHSPAWGCFSCAVGRTGGTA
jgi:hypothetical protein